MNYDEVYYGKIIKGLRPTVIPRIKPVGIHGVEVTQAIQYYHSDEHLTDSADQQPDNSVRLVSGKPAWVRVYVRRHVFTSDMAGITGTIDLYQRRLGIIYDLMTTLNPEPPGTVTARHDPAYDQERGTLSYSLNFIIPVDKMCGHLKLKVQITTPEGDTDELDVFIDATLQQTLNVRVSCDHLHGRLQHHGLRPALVRAHA